MKYKLLVLDLDGTLMNSKKEITAQNKKMLLKFQKAGGQIVLASGRPTYGIIPWAKELQLKNYNGYILSFNGGSILECKSSKIIFEKVFSENVPSLLYRLAKENNVNIMTYEKDYLITENKDDPYVKKESMINNMKIKEVPSFSDYITFPVNKCLMVKDGDYLAEVEKTIKQKVGDSLSVYRSEPFFLEIMPQNIDKAESLKKLIKYLHMDISEIAACGDGFNDISMIKFAGLGVAMENAQEIVKKAADYIVPNNDKDGVAFLAQKLLLNV